MPVVFVWISLILPNPGLYWGSAESFTSSREQQSDTKPPGGIGLYLMNTFWYVKRYTFLNNFEKILFSWFSKFSLKIFLLIISIRWFSSCCNLHFWQLFFVAVFSLHLQFLQIWFLCSQKNVKWLLHFIAKLSPKPQPQLGAELALISSQLLNSIQIRKQKLLNSMSKPQKLNLNWNLGHFSLI